MSYVSIRENRGSPYGGSLTSQQNDMLHVPRPNKGNHTRVGWPNAARFVEAPGGCLLCLRTEHWACLMATQDIRLFEGQDTSPIETQDVSFDQKQYNG